MSCLQFISKKNRRRLNRCLSSLVFFSLLAISSPLSAQSSPEIEEVVVEAAGAGTIFSPVLWIYLLPMTLIVFALGAMIFHTSRRKELLTAGESPTLEEGPRLIHLPISSLPETPGMPVRESSAMAAAPSSDVPALQMQMLFSAAAATRQKECPQCKRTFQTIFELCPYDATTLRTLPKGRGGGPQKRTPLGRLKCTGCERRFEFGAKYCYGDGLPLIPDSNEEAASAPLLTVCQTCGHEGKPKDRICPHDGDPLTVIEPNDRSRIAPTIPLLLCKKCRRYASPGTVHCPHDGELLSPVLNARITALAPTGFGARRKLCRKCGTRFSGAAMFCSYDGTKLTPIN
ncbi:MAG: hypothetical protein ACNA8W_14625 [Bradymonadaceae bacterium]